MRALLHDAIAPHLTELLIAQAPSNDPQTSSSAEREERARRAAAIILEYELETGARSLPASSR